MLSWLLFLEKPPTFIRVMVMMTGECWLCPSNQHCSAMWDRRLQRWRVINVNGEVKWISLFPHWTTLRKLFQFMRSREHEHKSLHKVHTQLSIPPMILGAVNVYTIFVKGYAPWLETNPSEPTLYTTHTNTGTQGWHHFFLLSLYHKKNFSPLHLKRESSDMFVPLRVLVFVHLLACLCAHVYLWPGLCISCVQVYACVVFDTLSCPDLTISSVGEREEGENVRR